MILRLIKFKELNRLTRMQALMMKFRIGQSRSLKCCTSEINRWWILKMLNKRKIISLIRMLTFLTREKQLVAIESLKKKQIKRSSSITHNLLASTIMSALKVMKWIATETTLFNGLFAMSQLINLWIAITSKLLRRYNWLQLAGPNIKYRLTVQRTVALMMFRTAT